MSTQTTEDTPKKAALYVRVSTKRQEEKGQSLPEQIRLTKEYAEDRGWDVIGVWEDPAVSGGKDWNDRPKAAELMAMAEAGDVNVIVMTTLDRFSRSVVGGLTDFQRLREAEVGVVFLNLGVEGVEGGQDTLDTTTGTGELMFTMMLAFAQFERRLITSRMEAGRLGVISNGSNLDPQGRCVHWIGGQLPLGYTTNIDKKIVEDSAQAKNVRRIFTLRGEGHSVERIARILQSEGRTTRPRNGKPRKFSGQMVHEVIQTEAYLTGTIERRLTEDAEPTLFVGPALIEEAQWRKAHREVKGRKKVRDAGKKVHGYALSMRITHLHDDGTTSGMFGQSRPSGTGLRRWYRCTSSRATSTTEATCTGLGVVNSQMMSSVNADIIEAATLRWLLEKQPEDWQRLYEEALDDAEGRSFDAEQAEAEVERISAEIVRIEDGFDAGLYTAQEAAQRKREKVARRDDLETAVEEARAAASDLSARGVTIAALMNMPIVEVGGVDEMSGVVLTAEALDIMVRSIEEVLDTEPDRYGRSPSLAPTARNELERLVRALDVTVYVEANLEDPRRPLACVHVGALESPLHVHQSSIPKTADTQGADVLSEDQSSSAKQNVTGRLYRIDLGGAPWSA